MTLGCYPSTVDGRPASAPIRAPGGGTCSASATGTPRRRGATRTADSWKRLYGDPAEASGRSPAGAPARLGGDPRQESRHGVTNY
ncbi:hypothetical protein [Streptosporangium vulgare]|uniref:hypothetical protein n=1 Tax=Streptosporangium vulgare TaxID=46190 RepID=UPI0031DE837F